MRDGAPSSARLPLGAPACAPAPVAEANRLLPAINLFRVMANADALYPAYIRFVNLLFKRLELDAALLRMVVLHVARRSDCLYAWRQNVVVATSVGVTPEQVDALSRDDVFAACFDARQRTALAFTDEVINLIEVTDGTCADAKAAFSDRAITEMLYVIGTNMFISRVARTGRVPMDARPADAPPTD